MINRRILLLKTVDWQKKVLLVGSNANNGSNAGLSYFNSNNDVSNANSNVELLYI